MKKNIPFWTYEPEYHQHKKEILGAIGRAIESGKLILGKYVKRFEADFAAYCGCRYGIGVNSGTDAIFLGLKTLGIGEGDEVITVPNTAIPTVSAVVATGAKPVFIDIDLATLLMDPAKLESAITKRTKCIIPVHLYGNICDMVKINQIAKRHRLTVLEDCAQAAGAMIDGRKAGSMSDIAAFSFYPTKIIGAYGDGGMIVTNDKKLAECAEMLRMYGTKGEYFSLISGYNSRLDEIHASILLWKLKRIESYITSRERIATRYNEGLKNTELILPFVSASVRHVWHLYVVRHPGRDAILHYFSKKKIDLMVHYRHPIHLQAAYLRLGYRKGDFPNTEAACEQILSLPIYPEFHEAEQMRIIKELKIFLAPQGSALRSRIRPS